MPFDAWMLAEDLTSELFTERLASTFIEGAEALRRAGAVEVIAYLGSVPGCRRINDLFGRRAGLAEVYRVLRRCQAVPMAAGCSLAYDGTAEVTSDWHVNFLAYQQALLREFGMEVYTEATSTRNSRVFDRYPSFVLDSTFTAWHTRGDKPFPQAGAANWYTQQVNVLTTFTYWKNEPGETVRQYFEQLAGWQVAGWANVGLFDQLVPR